MQRLLPQADLVIMNTPEAGEVARSTLGIAGDRLAVLTNGYDEDGYGQIRQAPRPNAASERFRIFHSGALHLERAIKHERQSRWRKLLGGEVQPVRLLGRSHWYLLRALEALARDDPQSVERIELTLAGVLTERDHQALVDAIESALP